MPNPNETWIERVLASGNPPGSVNASIGRAKNVQVGNYNQQTITEIVGQRKADDATQVASALEELRKEFKALTPTLTEGQKYIGEDKLRTVESELTKETGTPSGDLVKSAGNWIVENIPDLAKPLASLLLREPVGRILANSGTDLLQWIGALTSRIMGSP